MVETGWCTRPNALLSSREAALYSDLSHILDSAPTDCYLSFKSYWHAHHFDYLHRCLKPRESHREFYELIWGYLLTEFERELEDVRTRCVFTMYTLYMTQIRKPTVKITVNVKTWEGVLTYARKKQGEQAAMIQALIDKNAFLLGIFTGLRSIGPEIPDTSDAIPRKPIQLEECDVMTGLVDLSELQQKQRLYHFAKHQAKQGILAHPSWFPQFPGNKTQLQEKLDSKDTSLLELTDPTLTVKIGNTLESIEYMKDTS